MTKMEIRRSAVGSLLYGSEHLQSFGYEIIAYAKKNCPEKHQEIHDIFTKHFNANCGPLHKYVNDLLKEQEK